MPGNLYRRGKVWWARSYVRGQEVRESLRTTDRKEAERRLKPWLARISARRFGEDRHAWEEAAGKYMTEIAPTALASSTAKRYAVSFRAVETFLRGRFLDEIDRRTLGQIATRPGAGRAPRGRDLPAVSVVLTAAEAWGWIDQAPPFTRRHLRERREAIVLPPDAEVAKFVAACHAYRFKGEAGTLGYLVEFLRHSGLRLEEAATLERSQIGGQGRMALLQRTKTTRARAVMLSAQATGTLKRCPVRLGSRLVFWWGEAGARYETASHLLSRIRAGLGVAWDTHDLRHLFAVEYLRRGVERLRAGIPYDPHEGGSIYDLQKQLGHSSVATTEIYLDHLTAEEQEIARRGALAG